MLSHDIHSKNIMKIIWYNNYLMKNNCINMGISILPLNGKLQLSVDKNALKRDFNEIKYRNKYGWHLRNYSWPVSLNDDFLVWKSQPHWCCWNCVFCFVMMHHFHVYAFFFWLLTKISKLFGFPTFDIRHTWWSLYQKHVMRSKERGALRAKNSHPEILMIFTANCLHKVPF